MPHTATPSSSSIGAGGSSRSKPHYGDQVPGASCGSGRQVAQNEQVMLPPAQGRSAGVGPTQPVRAVPLSEQAKMPHRIPESRASTPRQRRALSARSAVQARDGGSISEDVLLPDAHAPPAIASKQIMANRLHRGNLNRQPRPALNAMQQDSSPSNLVQSARPAQCSTTEGPGFHSKNVGYPRKGAPESGTNTNAWDKRADSQLLNSSEAQTSAPPERGMKASALDTTNYRLLSSSEVRKSITPEGGMKTGTLNTCAQSRLLNLSKTKKKGANLSSGNSEGMSSKYTIDSNVVAPKTAAASAGQSGGSSSSLSDDDSLLDTQPNFMKVVQLARKKARKTIGESNRDTNEQGDDQHKPKELRYYRLSRAAGPRGFLQVASKHAPCSPSVGSRAVPEASGPKCAQVSRGGVGAFMAALAKEEIAGREQLTMGHSRFLPRSGGDSLEARTVMNFLGVGPDGFGKETLFEGRPWPCHEEESVARRAAYQAGYAAQQETHGTTTCERRALNAEAYLSHEADAVENAIAMLWNSELHQVASSCYVYARCKSHVYDLELTSLEVFPFESQQNEQQRDSVHVVSPREGDICDWVTINGQTVTYYRREGLSFDADVVPLERWIAERRAFYQLRRLPFFRNFALMKNLKIWRDTSVRQMHEEVGQLLESRVLSLQPVYYDCLFWVISFCQHTLPRIKILSRDERGLYTLKELRAAVQRGMDEATQRLSIVEKDLHNECKRRCFALFDAVVNHAGTLPKPRSMQQKVTDLEHSLGLPAFVSGTGKLQIRLQAQSLWHVVRVANYMVEQELEAMCRREVLHFLDLLRPPPALALVQQIPMAHASSEREAAPVLSVQRTQDESRSQQRTEKAKSISLRVEVLYNFEKLKQAHCVGERAQAVRFFVETDSSQKHNLVSSCFSLDPSLNQMHNMVRETMTESVRILQLVRMLTCNAELRQFNQVAHGASDFDEHPMGDDVDRFAPWPCFDFKDILLSEKTIATNRNYLLEEFEFDYDAISAYLSKQEPVLASVAKTLAMDYLTISRKSDAISRLEQELARVSQLRADIALIEDSKQFGIIELSMSVALSRLASTPQNAILQLTDLIPSVLAERTSNSLARVQCGLSVLDRSFPVTAGGFVELIDDHEKVALEANSMQQHVEQMKSLATTFVAQGLELAPARLESIEDLQSSLAVLNDRLDSAELWIASSMDHFTKEVDLARQPLYASLEKLDSEVGNPELKVVSTSSISLQGGAVKVLRRDSAVPESSTLFEDPSETECLNQHREKVECLRPRFVSLSEQVTVHDHQQQKVGIFNESCSVFVKQIEREFQYLDEIWETVLEWRSLMKKLGETDFRELDHKDATTHCSEMGARFSTFEYVNCTQLAERLEIVNLLLGIAILLQNDSLRPQHWNHVRSILGIVEPIEHGVPLMSLVKLGFLGIHTQLREITKAAEEEDVLEKSVHAVEVKWNTIKLNIVMGRNDRLDMGSTIEVEEELGESLVMLGSLAVTANFSAARTKVDEWRKNISEMQRMLEALVSFQAKIIELVNVFSMPEVKRQLEKEVNVFQRVDEWWQAVLQDIHDDRSAVRVLLLPGLREKVWHEYDELERLVYRLAAFTQLKRDACPRLYILSDADIVNILREAATADSMPFQKCFQGISSLVTEYSSAHTTKLQLFLGMCSPEGEIVLWDRVGQLPKIEDWIQAIEDAMKRTIKRGAWSALMDWCSAEICEGEPEEEQFDSASHNNEAFLGKWVINSSYCAQMKIIASSVVWCRRLEEALVLNLTITDIHNTYLDEVVTKVRTSPDPMEQMMLSILIIDAVHCRDVSIHLAEAKVDSPTAFAWQCQLRNHWEAAAANEVVSHFRVRQLDFDVDYGFEYYGLAAATVITPLTERCCITITQACVALLAACLNGTAGIGKSETVRGLARRVGLPFVIVNCSADIDTQMVRQVLCGMCALGSWTCLDAAERAELVTLSSLAEQLSTLRTAEISSIGSKTIDFEGTRLKLNPAKAMILSFRMSSRSEVPNNLQALLRPITMTVPDYQCIAEVLLLSSGFIGSMALSRKLAVLHSRAATQLLQPWQYDFSARSMRAIISNAIWRLGLHDAGRITPSPLHSREDTVETQTSVDNDSTTVRRTPQTSESQHDILDRAKKEEAAVLKSICEFHMPQLAQEDQRMFSTFLSAVFDPAVHSERFEIDVAQLEQARELCGRCPSALKKLHLTGSSGLSNLVVQVHWMLQRRRGSILCGATGVGKSAAISCYIQSAAALCKDRVNGFSQIKFNVLNPKAFDRYDLFGITAGTNFQLKEGLFQTLVKLKHQKQALNLVCFDGPMDPSWAEDLDTVLDESSTLALSKSERLTIGPELRILFEVSELAHASPGTVSRCGLVCVPLEDSCTMLALCESWVSYKLPKVAPWLQQQDYVIVSDILKLIPDALKNVKAFPLSESTSTMTVSDRADPRFVQHFLSLFATALQPNPYWGEVLSPATLAGEKQNEGQAFHSSKASNESAAKLGTKLMNFGKYRSAKPSPLMISAVGSEVERAEDAGKDVFSMQKYLGACFAFAFVWSSGFFSNDGIQKRIEAWLKSSVLPDLKLPPRCTLQDVLVDAKRRPDYLCTWPVPDANELAERWKASASVFGTVLCYTPEMLRLRFLIPALMLKSGASILLDGPACTGRTLLASSVAKDLQIFHRWATRHMLFAPGVLPHHVQRGIEDPLEQIRGGLRPPDGRGAYYILDDVNMSRVDRFNAQPSIELVRHVLDNSSLYDKKRWTLRTLRDLCFIAVPSGVGTSLPERFRRHLFIFKLGQASIEQLSSMYGNVLNRFLSERLVDGSAFFTDVSGLGRAVGKATAELICGVMEQFKPIPHSCWCHFTLRAASHVIRGFSMAHPSNVDNADSVVRLWAHEAQRVFADRLQTAPQHLKFKSILKGVLQQAFGTHWNPWGSERPTCFSHLAMVSHLGSLDEKQQSQDELYREMPCGGEWWQSVLAAYLNEYNAGPEFSGEPLRMIFFKSAIDHICRALRIQHQKQGHLLCIGLPGLGKRTTLAFSATIEGAAYSIYGPPQLRNLAGFIEALKETVFDSGRHQKKHLVILDDRRVLEDSHVEIITILMRYGFDVMSTLMQADEVAALRREMDNTAPGAALVPEIDPDVLSDLSVLEGSETSSLKTSRAGSKQNSEAGQVRRSSTASMRSVASSARLSEASVGKRGNERRPTDVEMTAVSSRASRRSEGANRRPSEAPNGSSRVETNGGTNSGDEKKRRSTSASRSASGSRKSRKGSNASSSAGIRSSTTRARNSEMEKESESSRVSRHNTGVTDRASELPNRRSRGDSFGRRTGSKIVPVSKRHHAGDIASSISGSRPPSASKPSSASRPGSAGSGRSSVCSSSSRRPSLAASVDFSDISFSDSDGDYNDGSASGAGMPDAMEAAITGEDMYERFLSNVQECFHIGMCASPQKDALRSWCMKFPSFLNCLTVDLYESWPDEALSTIAVENVTDALSVVNEGKEGDDQVVRNITAASMVFFNHACYISETHQRTAGRYVYNSPRSFVEQTQLFKSMMADHYVRKMTQLESLRKGCALVRETNATVKRLRENLAGLEPNLAKQYAKAGDLHRKLAKRQRTAAETQRYLELEHDAVAERATRVTALYENAKLELGKVAPTIEQPLAAVLRLDKKAIHEMKSMHNPPPLVQMALECICLLISGKCDSTSVRHMLQDPNAMLKHVAEFDPNAVSNDLLKKVHVYIDNPSFTPDEVAKHSRVATVLCNWTHTVVHHLSVHRETQARAHAIKEAEVELMSAQQALRAKEIEYQTLQNDLAELNHQHVQATQEIERLGQEQLLNRQRLESISTLFEGLADKEVRWEQRIVTVEAELETLVGDMALCSAAVAYTGCISPAYRKLLAEKWCATCSSNSLMHSLEFSLHASLVEHVGLNIWALEGLQTDDRNSADSAAIIVTCMRWPVIVDPQRQAVEWIKRAEASNNLVVTHASSTRLGKQIALAFQSQTPILVEDCPESLTSWLPNEVYFSASGRRSSAPTMLSERRSSLKDRRASDEVVSRTATATAMDSVASTKSVNRCATYGSQDTEVSGKSPMRMFLALTSENPELDATVMCDFTVVDFTVTIDGVTERFLGRVLALEAPAIVRGRLDVLRIWVREYREEEACDRQMLELLSSSPSAEELIEDANLYVEAVGASAKAYQHLKETEHRQSRNEAMRREFGNQFRSVAESAAIAYYAALDLCALNPLFCVSLSHVLQWFSMSIKRVSKLFDDYQLERWSIVPDVGRLNPGTANKHYVEELATEVTYSILLHASRSVFLEHRVPLAFLTLMRLRLHSGALGRLQYLFLMRGADMQQEMTAEERAKIFDYGKDNVSPRKSAAVGVSASIVPPATWTAVVALRDIFSNMFDELPGHIANNLASWRAALHCPHPLSQDPPTDTRRSGSGPISVPASEVDTEDAAYRVSKLAVGKVRDISRDESSQEINLSSHYPSPWNSSRMSIWDRLLLVRALQPDQIIHAIRSIIKAAFGKRYLDTKPPDLRIAFEETDPQVPILLVLAPGFSADFAVKSLIESVHMRAAGIRRVSLGGQIGRALEVLKGAVQHGRWALLQNCHLADEESLTKLETAILGLHRQRLHSDFRLFLTSEPFDGFPASVLHDCAILALEPPVGIRGRLSDRAEQLTEMDWDGVMHSHGARNNTSHLDQALKQLWRQFLFRLCVFDAVVNERSRSEILGFCGTPFEFSLYDFFGARKILHIALSSLGGEECDNIAKYLPWNSLYYAIGSVLYGGHVADEDDMSVLVGLLRIYVSEEAWEKLMNFKKQRSVRSRKVARTKSSGSMVRNSQAHQREFGRTSTTSTHDRFSIVKSMKDATLYDSVTGTSMKLWLPQYEDDKAGSASEARSAAVQSAESLPTDDAIELFGFHSDLRLAINHQKSENFIAFLNDIELRQLSSALSAFQKLDPGKQSAETQEQRQEPKQTGLGIHAQLEKLLDQLSDVPKPQVLFSVSQEWEERKARELDKQNERAQMKSQIVAKATAKDITKTRKPKLVRFGAVISKSHTVDFDKIDEEQVKGEPDPPQQTDEPLRLFLKAEMSRCLVVLNAVDADIRELRDALKGLTHFSVQLDHVSELLLACRVPERWRELSGILSTSMSLGAWTKDLKGRVSWLCMWYRRLDHPCCYLAPYLYNPSALFAAYIQQCLMDRCDDETIFFEDVSYQAVVLSGLDMEADVHEPPESGVLLVGMYIACAHWDVRRETIDRPHKFNRMGGHIFERMPIINFIPDVNDEDGSDWMLLRVPIYHAQLLHRATSKNTPPAIMHVYLPCDSGRSEWLLRGVALFFRVDD